MRPLPRLPPRKTGAGSVPEIIGIGKLAKARFDALRRARPRIGAYDFFRGWAKKSTQARTALNITNTTTMDVRTMTDSEDIENFLLSTKS
jgi:hypothetical protein